MGYNNCGFASCSIDSSVCWSTITDMVLSTIIGISKFALMFVAPGIVNILEMVVKFAEYG